jgi:hypothetical protein
MDNLNNKLSDEAQSQPSCLGAVMCSNYNALLAEMGGDKDKTRIALKYMSWLIKDIEFFKNVDLEDYKEIWCEAYNYSCT